MGGGEGEREGGRVLVVYNSLRWEILKCGWRGRGERRRVLVVNNRR